MGKKKGTVPAKKAPSTSSKGKEKSKRASRALPALTIDPSVAPSAYKVKLPNPETKMRWSHLCTLKHKHCRFLHMETIGAMGIADDVLALANNLGFTRLFQANYKAYRGITLEFLSTLEVKRVNAVPVSLHFQLGNEPRELKVEELNALINTPEDASFLGCHNFDVQELWTQFCYMEEEEVPYYNPSHAKASFIRNPAFRYLHQLITSTILSRTDSGTCLADDFHILIAATKNI